MHNKLFLGNLTFFSSLNQQFGSLVAGGLRVDKFGEQPLPQFGPTLEDGGTGQARTEVGHITPGSYTHFVPTQINV